jgi:hypothetical protein
MSDPSIFETEANPYKVAWHYLITKIIAGYEPTDVIGMQRDPMLQKMSIIEREIIHEAYNNHVEEDDSEDNDQTG